MLYMKTKEYKDVPGNKLGTRTSHSLWHYLHWR